ncbi:FAD-dependent oxidoreductase [Phototrophicus methaneseepsis]|uniref:FAD-dependent oxidoreductase n=1 Tax=Phototrophicus methaneseepsis TaxID=2710758 RepID=A0A7S8ED65_9CHLR|nr:FAD-dependent oxidoreductase [Phototrophicus methaneseepsis]QPC84790.1 FAD-dependent oxidoreductase [Phototrophicus methaneseepsis]
METDVLIIGAGLSGLVAARELEKNDLNVTVIDKGRSVGGRLATRRIANGTADHGAQFFTARTNTFKTEIEQWLEADLVRVWGYGWSDGSMKRTVSDGHPRYVTNGGMNKLAKYLAEKLADVQVDVRVTDISWVDGQWNVRTEGEGVYTSRALLMTPPVPQALELLGKVPLVEDDMEALTRIQFGPCLCGIHVLEGDVHLPEPGAVQNFAKSVYWIADNKEKGITDQRIITTQAGTRWSKNNFDLPADEILAFLRAAVEPFFTSNTRVVEEELKRWEYSVPLITHPYDTLVAKGLPLAFAGDAFGGRGRMEGAYVSGLRAAEALVQTLK